jgi:cytochrome P450
MQKTRDVEDLDAVIKLGGVRAELPAVYDLIRLIPLRATREVLQATDRVMEYGWKAVRNARQQSLGQHNIFGGILSQSQKGDGKMTDMDVNVEASSLIVAGSGTTAVTLTYLIYAVLQRPEVQEALEAEVRDSLSDDFGDTELEKLPTLNATIDETLRLYGAAPGSLPRIVPAGGAQLGGYYLPAGTTVCTQSFSIHRNPDNFADPNRLVLVKQDVMITNS